MPREIKGKIQKFLLIYCLVGLISSCAQGGDRNSNNAQLTVSAAASMQDALTDVQTLYQQKYPQTKIIFNFGSSGSLQHQIEQGAPIDLFISAAPQQMDNLAKKQLLLAETRQNLVENQMVLVVPKGDRSIDRFTDLTEESIQQIALGEPNSVPAGQYAQEILTNLNIIDAVKSKAVYGKDVRQVLNYVATGNVDAGIVYRSDTVNNDRVEVVAIAPERTYSPVVYPIAIIKDSNNHQAAQQMLQFLLMTEAQAVFQQHGFIPINN